MFRKSRLYSSLSSLIPVLVKVHLPVLICLIVGTVVARWLNVSFYELSADPSEIAHLPPYTGFLSNLGLLLWGAVITLCLFSASLIKSHQPNLENYFLFLIASSALTGLLLLDDMLQLHESLHFIFFGVDALVPSWIVHAFEISFFIVEFGLTIAYLFYFRRLILGTEYLLLVLSFSLFVFSIAFDVLFDDFSGKIFLEDGSKFLGVVTWLVYFSKTCSAIAQKTINTSPF